MTDPIDTTGMPYSSALFWQCCNDAVERQKGEAERRERARLDLAAKKDVAGEAARRMCVVFAKNRARAFIRFPWQLDMICPGLSTANPRLVLAIVAHEQEKVDRFVGFSRMVRPANFRGAAIYARWVRRNESRDVVLMAAE